MAEDRVLTYEATSAGVVLVGRHESLAASSATLPNGAYTTLRTYHGRRVLQLPRHLDRLNESIALEGGEGMVDCRAVRAALSAVLDATSWPQTRLRLTFAPPRLFLAAEPFVPLSAAVYQSGVDCLTVPLHRENPHAKDTRFIATARAAYGRLPAGIEEGLLVEKGSVLEGLSSNFFGVVDGVLRTEEERVLLGVTRSSVLELADGLFPVDRRAVRLAELPRASEAFLTSVSRELLPVVRIDGRAVGDGRVGPVARGLGERFAALVAREAEKL
jgi:branched-chain amino acid aminotransferase